jgi:hypothetical protein
MYIVINSQPRGSLYLRALLSKCITMQVNLCNELMNAMAEHARQHAFQAAAHRRLLQPDSLQSSVQPGPSYRVILDKK